MSSAAARRRARHPLSGGAAPRWADAWGEDAFGPWVEIHLGERRRAGAWGAAATRVGRGAGQRFRWIPEGEVTLGAPTGAWGRWDYDWAPTRWRLERGFWLADTPCTSALWTEVTGGDAGEAPDVPRTKVTWEDAQAFFAALRARDPALAFELPSEARWEYACRAGTETTTYAGEIRNDAEATRVLYGIAWSVGNLGGGGAKPVATKAPNAWGLYDMLGNVWEWCEDAWVPGGAPRPDGDGPAPGDMGSGRVLRGGSWVYGARFARAAYRYASHPGLRHSNYGFRLSRGQ